MGISSRSSDTALQCSCEDRVDFERIARISYHPTNGEEIHVISITVDI